MNKIKFRSIKPFYSKLQRCDSVADGVLVSSMQFVDYDAREHIYSSEFSLGNLIAIGAAGNLTYVCMDKNSDMNFVDRFAESLKS